MKKNLKKTCAKALAVVLALGMVAATPVDAKKASVKLSKTKVTVTKGKTVKVTVKKGKVKTWSVNKAGKKVVKLAKKSKKYVKIKGLKAGKATVTAKFTNKAKKNIKVTVKAAAAKNNNPSKATDVPKTPDAPKASDAPAKATDTPAPTKPAASATPAPTAKPTSVPFDGKVELSEANAAGFTTSGSYCTVKFNAADGSFDYDSTPSAEDATGSVYNNGCAFYIDKVNKEPVDLAAQGYEYVAIKVKTDAEFKLMTWSDPDLVDTENFWDKNDTWGSVVKTIANEDGSKTLVYAVEDVFTDSELACTIGFTLKSDGADEDTFLARQGTVYSIEFTKEMPAGEAVATPVPATATPVPTENTNLDKENAVTYDVNTDATITNKAWADMKTVAFDGDLEIPVKAGDQVDAVIEVKDGETVLDDLTVQVMLYADTADAWGSRYYGANVAPGAAQKLDELKAGVEMGTDITLRGFHAQVANASKTAAASGELSLKVKQIIVTPLKSYTAPATGAIAVSSTAAVVGDEFNAATELVLNGNTVTSYAWTVSGSALAVKGDADKATATFEAKEAGKASVICTVVTSGNTLTLEKEINVTSDKVEDKVVDVASGAAVVTVAAAGKDQYQGTGMIDLSSYLPEDVTLYSKAVLEYEIEWADGSELNGYGIAQVTWAKDTKDFYLAPAKIAADFNIGKTGKNGVTECDLTGLDSNIEKYYAFFQNSKAALEKDFKVAIKKITFVAK